jgi:hypothetical protein
LLVVLVVVLENQMLRAELAVVVVVQVVLCIQQVPQLHLLVIL